MKINKLWDIALFCAVVTVLYNIFEGLISIYFGAADETLALLGFGIDSFVEVLSGVGIWHMILLIKNNAYQKRDDFEKTALKITGTSFYILSAGLILSAAYNIYCGTRPQTTFWGIIISSVSIATMFFLMYGKLRVGRELNSDAIIADANCTKTCIYLSFILLASSVLYEVFRIGYFDSLGALGIAYFAYKEGKESFERAEGKE